MSTQIPSRICQPSQPVSRHAPTLVIHGESDRLVPAENGRIIAERVPGARVRSSSRASHILFTDQSEAAHGAMLGFLDELWPSGR
jgi:pimeloyl-ACP methyl ester carboxylesterase